jgi:hypothetical protein
LNLSSFVYHHEVKCYVLLLWRYMTYVLSICLSSEGKRYGSWLWGYMAYVESNLAVASYYCIMCILVMSICIEPGWWESHITILECSWAWSVRKLNDYSRVLLWIMLLTYDHDHTGTASYVARGGVRCSFIPCWVWRQWTCICIAFALFEVLCWNEVGYEEDCFYYMRSNVSFIRWGVLSYSYAEVVHLFYILSLVSLWKFCWIYNFIMNLLFIIMTSILLWLNWCLIKL